MKIYIAIIINSSNIFHLFRNIIKNMYQIFNCTKMFTKYFNEMIIN